MRRCHDYCGADRHVSLRRLRRQLGRQVGLRLKCVNAGPIYSTINLSLSEGRLNSARKGDRFMNIRPLHDRVIVTRLEEERKTAAGIVIPDTAAEKPETGEVIAVGNGEVQKDGKVRPLDVKKGDKILFGKYSGQTVKVEGIEYLVMREGDILGVFE
jgi:chaperonin GroES